MAITFRPITDAMLSAARPRPLRYVYPARIAMLVRNALRKGDPDGIIASVDNDIQTIGANRYAVRLHDVDGTTYRITVEVEPTSHPSEEVAA